MPAEATTVGVVLLSVFVPAPVRGDATGVLDCVFGENVVGDDAVVAVVDVMVEGSTTGKAEPFIAVSSKKIIESE